MDSKKEENNRIIRRTRPQMIFSVHYPEQNPRDSIDSISDALKHIGVFDDINLQSKE